MQKIILDNDAYQELFVLTETEYLSIPKDYRGFASFDKRIRVSFLPGFGTTLFYENKHFLVINENEPIKDYEIWRYRRIIGHCQIPARVANKANAASNAEFYFKLAKKNNV